MGHRRLLAVMWVVLGLLVFGVLTAFLLAEADGVAPEAFRWPVFALVATAWALLAFFLARCYENLHQLRVVGWGLSPGTLVAGMLVPLLNLFVLFVAVSELWKTSYPWGGDRNLAAWRSRRIGVTPIVWWITMTALWLAGALVAARVLAGTDPAIAVALFSLTAVFWAIATYALVSRLAARQVERRSEILSTYRTQAGVEVARAVYARPPAELELNHAFGVIGFALLALRAIQLLLGFLGLNHPLFALVSAQAAFLVASMAIAGLQGVPLGKLLESGPARPRDLGAGAAVGLCFPLLTIPIAIEMIRFWGLPTSPEEASNELLLGYMAVSVLFAPFIEEVVFRGILYQAFDRALQPAATVLVTAAAFGLAHVHVVQSPVTLFLGLACGYARWKTGSLAAPIAIHLGNNLGVFGLSMAGVERPAALWIVLGLAVVATGLTVLSGSSLPLEIARREYAGSRARLEGGSRRLAPWVAAARDFLRVAHEKLPGWIAAVRRLEWGPMIVTLGLAIAAVRSAAAGVAFLEIAPLGMGRFLAACYYGFLAAALARGQRARAAVLALPLAWYSLHGVLSPPRQWGMRATELASHTGSRILSLVIVLAGILVAIGFRPWVALLQWRRPAGVSPNAQSLAPREPTGPG
jgi:membrane protease YdiL (CAAX protease family)